MRGPRLAPAGLLAGAGFLVLVALSAGAQEAAAPQVVASGWTLSCQFGAEAQALSCEAAQVLTLAQSEQTFVAARITPTGPAGASVPDLLRLQLPHGVDVPAGISILIDDKLVAAPQVQTSGPAGLYARTDLTPPLLAALRQGTTMAISFSTLTGQTLSVPVPLQGFAAVYNKLK